MLSYRAGLWVQDLPYNLAWNLDRSFQANVPHKRPKFRAPSWSWASVDDKIYHWRAIRTEEWCVELISCTTVLGSPIALFGEVLSGQLQIRGLLRKIPYYKIRGSTITLLDLDFHLLWKRILDAIEVDSHTGSSSCNHTVFLFCLFQDKQELEALILLKRASENVYTRIGIDHWWKPIVEDLEAILAWEKSFQIQDVTIV